MSDEAAELVKDAEQLQKRAIAAIRRRVYAAIAAAYPAYSLECQRQIQCRVLEVRS